MTEQTKGTANRGTAAFLHVTARRRPQDVRLSRVPQLNLNFEEFSWRTKPHH